MYVLTSVWGEGQIKTIRVVTGSFLGAVQIEKLLKTRKIVYAFKYSLSLLMWLWKPCG